MKPSRATLTDLSAALRYDAASLELVCHLLDILAAVLQDRLLSERLVLKGGTALNLMRDPPPRLSVDLDFNDVGAEERAKMLEDQPKVVDAVARIGRRLGYQVQQTPDKHAGVKLFFRGPSVVVGNLTLKVDLNFLHRVSLGPPKLTKLWTPFDSEAPQGRVVALEELVAGKLLALLDRTAARDLFDAALLNDDPPVGLDADRLRPVFVALSSVLPHALNTYAVDRLDRVTADDIERNLAPLLAAGQTADLPSWRKSATRLLRPLLKLSVDEAAFVDGVQRGVLDPALLAGTHRDLALAIARHPAILWKVANAAKHVGNRDRRAPLDD